MRVEPQLMAPPRARWLVALALLPWLTSAPRVAGAAAEATVTPARTTIPITQVRLSDGQTRYAIRILVEERPVTVGLDTGSVGLRLLPAAQSGLVPTNRPDSETFGSGVALEGPVARGTITIGARSDNVGMQQVTSIHCAAGHENCGARLGLAQFRLMGNGVPGEGFDGIIGIKPAPAAIPRNPLMQLGVHRWIVSVPLPGDPGPGMLILDPDARDMAGFHTLPRASAPGQVMACLYRPTPVPAKACGPTTFDTGAPGLGVFNASMDPRALEGAPARLVFAEGTSEATDIALRLNDRRQMTRYTVATRPGTAGTQIHAGVTPYLAYDVLYDADAGTVSVRARAPFPGGPVAHGG